ncbi:MAG: NAD(P)-binding domain-containing protein [Chloroflexota bacterium]|nr:NAD(P)-binding domain-containing protein [Chloroflexota bacterium]
MKIGILGAGLVGTNLAKALINAGHEVMLSSREPDGERMQKTIAGLGANARAGMVEDTLNYSNVVAIALDWDAIYDVVKVGDWTDKIVIDMTNRFGDHESPAHELATLTKAHIVKAFNTIGAENYPNPTFGGIPATMFIAGDNTQAKHTVAELVRAIGFDLVDAGDLQAAHHLENLAAFWAHLAFRAGHGRAIAFKLLHR